MKGLKFNTQWYAMIPLGIMIWFSSCENEIVTEPGVLPFNPYDTLTYPAESIPDIPVDSNSFVGIHKYILSVKCAVNGCHNGSFEPDYRTVQSAYSTLVYAPVVKNTANNFFEYRVIPFDTLNSWLWYRLTTTDQTLGKMPLYDTLFPSQLSKIKSWIINGAPDLFGSSPDEPTYVPTFYGVVAYLTDQNDFRVDTIRGGNDVFPFMVAHGSNLRIWFGIIDDITAPFLFTYNEVKFSTDRHDWNNAVTVPLHLEILPWYETLFEIEDIPFFAYCDVNTSQWDINDIVYMRAYVKDNDHPAPTELPDSGSQIYIQTYCSFIIQ